ncbi:hypothetical protein CLOSTMETH_03008, partial [[Clostridium] methylpentosum DSM 5476]
MLFIVQLADRTFFLIQKGVSVCVISIRFLFYLSSRVGFLQSKP